MKHALQLAVLSILDTTMYAVETIFKHTALPMDTVVTDLESPFVANWSVQGFGVLRLYIRNLGRLHLWHEDLRYPNVSLVHNHSWDLESAVVCGRLVNLRWTEDLQLGYRYMRQRLLTGYDSRMEQPAPQHVWLLDHPREVLKAGDVYRQRAEEIHASVPDNNTITLMTRRENDGPGFADVFWKEGDSWGTAKPRRATLADLWRFVPEARMQLLRELEQGVK